MAITPNHHHDSCTVYIQLENKSDTRIYAQLRCKDHNKWIQWLSRQDVAELRQFGVTVNPVRVNGVTAK
jgi:hypothetical protein